MMGYNTDDSLLDAMCEPTPHEAYVQNLTPRVAERLLDAIKSQAMKDYINALAELKYFPHDEDALKVVNECEQLFSDAGKLKTVRQKVKYDGGMFEIICKEHYPTHWGDPLPSGDDKLKCPICKEGRIGRFYRPRDPLHPNKKEAKDPRIICSCDVCTYKFVSHIGDWSDEAMKEISKTMKSMALKDRDRLCRQEVHDILRAHPEYTQAEKDAVYRRMANKWKV